MAAPGATARFTGWFKLVRSGVCSLMVGAFQTAAEEKCWPTHSLFKYGSTC